MSVYYQRIPKGLDTCEHCLMLCAMGPMQADVGSIEEIADTHTGCQCTIVQAYDLDDWSERIEAQYAYDRHNAAVDALREKYPDDPLMWTDEKIREEIKRQQPFWDKAIADVQMAVDSEDQSSVFFELLRRNPLWKSERRIPEILFADDKLEIIIRTQHPQEILTAERLVKQGYPVEFQYDYVHYFDEGKGIFQTIGLADDRFGKEFKYVTREAVSPSSVVSNAYANSRNKKGVNLLVIDNADSYLSDQDIISEVRKRTESRTFIPTLIIRKDESLILVK